MGGDSRAAFFRFNEAWMPVTESGCWIWLKHLTNTGYGSLRVNAKNTLAHRFAYSTLRVPLLAEECLDHLCRVRCCVNPDHLEIVSRGENVLRGNTIAAMHKAKRSCIYGHPFDSVNTHLTRLGHRRCRTCDRLAHQQRRINHATLHR